MKGLLKRRATAEESRARAFKREYDDLKDRLDSIRANYDNVSDEPSIDALIYEENAVLCRLSALYRRQGRMVYGWNFRTSIPLNSRRKKVFEKN